MTSGIIHEMKNTLEQFISECRTILTSEPGPSGRRQDAPGVQLHH